MVTSEMHPLFSNTHPDFRTVLVESHFPGDSVCSVNGIEISIANQEPSHCLEGQDATPTAMCPSQIQPPASITS